MIVRRASDSDDGIDAGQTVEASGAGDVSAPLVAVSLRC